MSARLLPLLVALLLAGGALGEHGGDGGAARLRDGSAGELRVVPRGPGEGVGLELRTQSELTGRSELALFARPPGEERELRKRIAPAVEPGRYVLELPGREAGEWILTFRYGVGLDIYYATARVAVGPDEAATVHPLLFRGGIAESAPRRLQALGFAMFAVVALLVLALVAAVLRRLRSAQLRSA